MLIALGTTSFKPVVTSEETMNREVIVQAPYGNSDYVYVSFGDPNVSSTDYHFQLKGGDAIIVSDMLTDIYAVGGAASQNLSKAYYQRNVNFNRRVS